jgi:hypothetical protein
MLLLSLTLACSGLSSLDATDQLTIKAISGEEEGLAENGLADPDDAAAEVAPLFRECDPAGLFQRLKDQADTDGDGQLSSAEERECTRGEEGGEPPEGAEGQGGPPGGIEQHRMMMLGFIYDADDSESLDEDERETLFADFEVRCESLHARILEDFDADGDGELSDGEKEAALAAIEAEREQRHAEMEQQLEERERPEDVRRGERPDVPAFATDYDVDGDGELSDEELATLREEARERIRAGEPPFDPPAE